MFKKFGLTSLLFLLSSSVYAEWELVTTSGNNEYGIYLNTDYINPSTNDGLKTSFVDGWVKEVVLKDLEKDGQGVGDHSMFHYTYSCDDRKFKLNNVTTYSKDTVIDSFEYPYSNYNRVVPDSLSEVLLDASCTVAFGPNYREILR